MGASNHNFFFIFITLLFIFLLFNIGFSIRYVNIDIHGLDDSWFKIEALTKIFEDEWYSRVFLIINIVISFIAVLLNGYVLFIQAGNFLTNYTTYERFSHEGIAARKRRKRYLAKLKNKTKGTPPTESVASLNLPSEKYKDKESNNSDNAKTNNTFTRNLMGEDSSTYPPITLIAAHLSKDKGYEDPFIFNETSNPSIVSIRSKPCP